ncbi:hypothetical protein AB8880_11495 [Alphaproteobacteria bacterium LSUCC0684]
MPLPSAPAGIASLMILLDSEDVSAIRHYLSANRAEILEDGEKVVLALILWRRLGDVAAAATLAEEAQSRGLGGSRRLDYEIAVSYWQNGSCRRAVPLFRKLRQTQQDPADWMSEDSARFLLDCTTRSGSFFHLETGIGYDANLGQTVPARRVMPETGSVVDAMLGHLHLNQPDGSPRHTFVIGTPARKGFWTEVQPRLEWRYPLVQGGLTLRLGSMARATSHREYHGQGHHVAALYHHRAGRHTLSASAQLRHDTESLGPEAGHRRYKNRVFRLSSASRLDQPFYVLSGITARKLKGMGDSPFSSRYVGVDIGIAHQGRPRPRHPAELGFRLIATRGQERAIPRWNTGQHHRIALALGPFMIGRMPFLIEARRDHKSFAHIRPWLRDHHDRKRDTLMLTSSYAFVQDYPVTFEFERYKSRSRDPLDQEEGLKFTLRFRH